MCETQVIEKTLGGLDAVDDTTGSCKHPSAKGIALEVKEIGLEIAAPVLHTHLVAINL